MRMCRLQVKNHNFLQYSVPNVSEEGFHSDLEFLIKGTSEYDFKILQDFCNKRFVRAAHLHHSHSSKQLINI